MFVPNSDKIGQQLWLLETYYVNTRIYIQFRKPTQNVFWGPTSVLISCSQTGSCRNDYLNSSLMLWKFTNTFRCSEIHSLLRPFPSVKPVACSMVLQFLVGSRRSCGILPYTLPQLLGLSVSTLRSRPSPQTALSNYKARGVNVPHRLGLVSVSETRSSRQQM